jgi:threonine dehydrogenase-like Zn-dependent dehydrogenase
MRASIIVAPRKSEIQEVVEPQITKANQIKIKVLVCGLCTSEIERWTGENSSIGQILGHEPVGIIVEKGNDVTEFEIGDRVAAGFCHFSFADYTIQDADLFAKVPDELSDEEAIGEPASCVLGAIDRVPIGLGNKVAVVGCGYMGLMTIAFLKMRGCSKIVAVDSRSETLQRALKYGADEVYTPQELKPEHFVDGFNERTFLDGFDAVFEVTGNEKALQMSSRMVRGNGYLDIIGFHTTPRQLDIRLWNLKSLNVINGHEKRMPMRGKNVRAFIELVKEKKFSMKELMTHEYQFDEVDKGFEDMIEKKVGYIKGYVRINQR